MHLVLVVLSILVTCALAVPGLAAGLDLTGIDVSRFAAYYDTLPPTPKGEWYLDPLKSGDTVQIRYAIPKKRPLSFQLDFHNIVPLNGGGKSYHLQLRRDSPAGPIIYDGPVTNCFFWASQNRDPLEVGEWLTDEDLARGYLDVYATGYVTDDPWTMWRDNNGTNRDLRSLALEDTPALRKALADTQLIRDKDIRLIPWPQKITAKHDIFSITGQTRILLHSKAGQSDLFTAELLRDEIKKLSGYAPRIVKGLRGATKHDIVLKVDKSAPAGDQSYRLNTDSGFRASSRTSTGLFYAVQTAVQLLQKKNGRTYFAGVEIVDSPNLQCRMVQYDLARYQTVNITYLKRIVREMSRFKLNQLMLYMEDDFKYTKYPFTGKPGTFTPATARDLVNYARKYHVEIVPQLEALGHGTALLSHPEFADLRENGNSWVFDTSNPRTWQVLDDMIGELAKVFNNTKYIHLGCDEFEDGFGQCPRCKDLIDKIGWGRLYAMHLSRLNQLAKKHKRTMIFWTSHGGKRTDVQGNLTLKYADLIPKDMIPMEWLYDGFEDYPTVKQLQEAGFSKVFVAPGVMGYAMVNADCGLSFRSVRTFYRYGAARKALGGCACTWELASGAQLETHLYGLIYSGQCGWNTDACGEDAFDRAFARHWFGLKDCNPAPIRRIFRNEDGRQGKPIFWANSAGTSYLFWLNFNKLKDYAGPHWPQLVAAADDMEKSADETLVFISEIRKKAAVNQVTLDATANTVRMYRATARKIKQMDRASSLYRRAVSSGQNAAGILGQAIYALKPLRADYPDIIAGFKQARDQRGAAPQDVDNTMRVSKSLDELIKELDKLRNNPPTHLPPAEELGL